MRSSLRTMLLATGILTSVALCAQAQELVTADHVGKTDAPNTLTMRLNTDQSPNAPVKAIGELYGTAWQKWAEAHPDWQVQFEFFSQDIGAEHARLLEQARAGRSPDCVTVDSFQLALFVENGVLQPLDEYFSKEEIDDLFPFIREGITGADGKIYAWWWGTDLRVLYYNTEIVATPRRPGRRCRPPPPRRRRRRRRALQRWPLGRYHLRLAGELLGAGRRARGRQRQADLRRGGEPREGAERRGLLQGPGGQRRRAGPGGDDQGLQ